MSTYKTQGIVLRRVNYGEADRILTFITMRGKVSAIAKGVRRLHSKLGGHLEPFNVVELMLAQGRNLEVVTSARIAQTFGRIQEDYERLRRGFLMLEMTDKLTGEEASGESFELVRSHLEALQGHEPALVELAFKLKLLQTLGYEPNLSQCAVSHSEVTESKRYAFSLEHGGVVELISATSAIPKIANVHIKLWRLLLSRPVAEVTRVKGVAAAAAESLPVCDEFYDYLFSKRFKSNEI